MTSFFDQVYRYRYFLLHRKPMLSPCTKNVPMSLH